MRAEDVLPDGVERTDVGGASVRKGTVGAFLGNARVWCDAGTDFAERARVEADIVGALPALRATGLFDILAVREPALAALVAAHAG